MISLADGRRAYGHPELVTTLDRWHLGSITKSMTATLVARCVDAGLLSWDQTIGSVLGAAIPDMRDEYRDASFRHLLCHHAGLQANIRGRDFNRYRSDNPDPREERISFARQALQQKPVGPMETSFAYSNNGYVVVGAMLEAILGAPWESLIRERLFDPLGMTSTGFGAPGTLGVFDQPVGHSSAWFDILDPHHVGRPFTDNPAVLGPAGRVHASLPDALAFLAAHRDRTELLREETWRMLHTPPFGGTSAMGWGRRGDTLSHTGSNTLWYAGVQIDFARGVGAVAVSNDGRLQSSRPAVDAALMGAIEAVA
jgi:CubicO group peptidase (beta-lactamase class C family)